MEFYRGGRRMKKRKRKVLAFILVSVVVLNSMVPMPIAYGQEMSGQMEEQSADPILGDESEVDDDANGSKTIVVESTNDSKALLEGKEEESIDNIQFSQQLSESKNMEDEKDKTELLTPSKHPISEEQIVALKEKAAVTERIILDRNFFPDAVFRQVISESLNVTEGTDITDKLSTFFGFQTKLDIESFSGIQYLNSLNVVILSEGTVPRADLSASTITGLVLDATNVTELLLPESISDGINLAEQTTTLEAEEEGNRIVIPYADLFQYSDSLERVILDKESEKYWEKGETGFVLKNSVAGIPSKLSYNYKTNATTTLKVNIEITNAKEIFLDNELIGDSSLLQIIRYSLQSIYDGEYFVP